jgi:hypothetical protein
VELRMTTLNQAVKTLTQRAATQAALRNEQMTRDRVTRLERTSKFHDQAIGDLNHVLMADVRAVIYDRTFWGRIKWLLRGK